MRKLWFILLWMGCAPVANGTITFFGAASAPADNGTQVGATVAVTPPASMLAGDLAVIIAQNRSGTVGNIRISEPGGQGWSFTQELVDSSGGLGSSGVATALVVRKFWCTF